jgi:hypothetical protein
MSSDELAEIQTICPEAVRISEGQASYIYLPRLRLPPGCEPPEVEGLLRPGPGPDGYTTRLFFSTAFPHKGQNWTVHRILDKAWHAFSYNNVPSDLRLVEILANHLRVLQ